MSSPENRNGNTKMKYLLAFVLFLSSCCSSNCPKPGFQNVTNYKVYSDFVTPKGTKIDTGGLFSDKAQLQSLSVKWDSRIDAISDCVQEVAKQNTVITAQQQNEWGCLSNWMDTTPIKRCCFFIKVVQPVASQCQSTWQLLPDRAPDQFCQDKGLEPTPECPCRWRNASQDSLVIVTPPVMYLWALVELKTRCNNLWKSPFAKCMGKGLGYE